MHDKFPNSAEEYEKQATNYISPFTGEEKEIELKLKVEKKVRRGGMSNV